MAEEKIKQKISQLPTSPGVYLFKNPRGTVIYIGKAKNIRNRVRSYFVSRPSMHPKLRALLNHIHDVETIVVDTEVEALILENNLIKKYKPRYNIDLKDDKSYPYIRITNEPFPRVFPTRRIVKDGSEYLGPYTDVKNLRTILKGLRKIFPIRSCKLPLTEESIKAGKFKVCLDYHIQRCEGPCIGEVTEEKYQEMIQNVKKLLSGKTKELIRDLKKEMEKAAKELAFEKAARIRDQIQLIENFYFTPPTVASGKLKDMDVIALSRTSDDGAIVLFRIRDGKIIGKMHKYISRIEEKTDEEIIDSFLSGDYIHQDNIPNEIILPVETEFLDGYREFFREKRQMSVHFLVPVRGDKRKLLQMVQKNADILLQELLLQKIQKESRIHHSVLMLQKDLRLKHPPIRIEAFDISNIQGKHPVASMVCFENGKPKKSDYRHYHIRSIQTPNDFKMMEEVISRRYQRVLNENIPLPDLILIDGGKGQLNVAKKILVQLDLSHIPVIGLAKREEEVFIPGQPDSLPLDRESAGVKLLRYIRDEAHRFAITFHRKIRRKENVISILDEIPGIGAKRKKILYQTFGSIEHILTATEEEIASLPSFNHKIARELKMYLNEHYTI
jgi:excinuclease ABC subunit C